MVKGLVRSMTGFATRRGAGADHEWVWDIRSLNGKGFDLRLRLPDWIEGLEGAVRAAVAAGVGRGSVTLGLRIGRAAGAETAAISPAGLRAALAAVGAVEGAAAGVGLVLAPATAVDILTMRGVLDQGAGEGDTAALLPALIGDLPPLLDDFNAMRAAEGARLGQIIGTQIAQIDDLTKRARAAADARRPQMEAVLKDNLGRVLAGAAEADPARIAQELALMAVRADVTEEIDRLGAHVAAARALLAEPGAIGRKFDFLTQEFLREANTLCSKSGNADLTRIGLELKTVIDQMREQVQNVE